MLYFQLMEATGVGPTTEIAVVTPKLLANDVNSTSSSAKLIRLQASGAPAYSCERWLRLRYPSPMGAVTNMRVWSPGLALPEGWQINFGSSQEYRTPTSARSDYAYAPLLADDPGVSSPNVIGDMLVDDQGEQTSPWLVFQAILTGFPADQNNQELTLRFGWAES